MAVGVQSSGKIQVSRDWRTTLKQLAAAKLTLLELVIPLFFVGLVLLEEWVVDDVGVVHGAPA